MMCNQIIVGSLTFLLTKFYRDYKRRPLFLSYMMSQGNLSIVFLPKYKTKNLVRMFLLLSEFSPFVFD
jgi:hypothetical protein